MINPVGRRRNAPFDPDFLIRNISPTNRPANAFNFPGNRG